MKIVLWVSFYFMTFVGLIAAMFLSRQKIVEETREVPVLNDTGFHDYVAALDSTSLHLVDSLGVVMEGMLGQLSYHVNELQRRDSTIQSLKTELAGAYQENESLQKTIESLRIQNKEKIDQEKKIQDLAKTLGSMKSDVLGPILKNLPDDVIRIVYDKAKTRDRTKIFNSLAPERAGRIMRKMAGKPNRKKTDADQDS